ncbi:MAG: hypothetical protein Q8K93_01175, partial [Reyranella sp.]|nr:hypothetical protein [Reyranella sp.]
MATSSRYYDGATALVHEVGVRVTASELIILRPADSAIVVRWPIAELAVLGDGNHEAAPPVVRRGGEARLVIEDVELRQRLAALVPELKALDHRPAPLVPRLATLGVTLVALV